MNKEPTRARDLQTDQEPVSSPIEFTQTAGGHEKFDRSVQARNGYEISVASFRQSVDALTDIFDLPRIPKIEPVNEPVCGFSEAFLRQVDEDLKRMERADAAKPILETEHV